MLLHTFLYWSLKVLKILNEGIFCNHAVITVLLFRSLILVCSRNITDLLGMSEMSIFVKLGSAKPIIFHKGGKCIYSIMFLWLLIAFHVSLAFNYVGKHRRITGVYPIQKCTCSYTVLINILPTTICQWNPVKTSWLRDGEKEERYLRILILLCQWDVACCKFFILKGAWFCNKKKKERIIW